MPSVPKGTRQNGLGHAFVLCPPEVRTPMGGRCGSVSFQGRCARVPPTNAELNNACCCASDRNPLTIVSLRAIISKGSWRTELAHRKRKPIGSAGNNLTKFARRISAFPGNKGRDYTRPYRLRRARRSSADCRRIAWLMRWYRWMYLLCLYSGVSE